ncbi:Fasciclin-2 [Blattella germanica]|nr:Fasciclin-2 [Blattella germanica]
MQAGMHTEEMPDGLALIIPVLQARHAGAYNCTAKYATTENLSKMVIIKTFVKITWEDAPEEQYPILHKDYKVRCKVTANPAPLVNWLRNGEQVQTEEHFVVEPDGLTIKNATEEDDGIYTCRAIVIDTGELAERNIRVEVHTPPKIAKMNTDLRIIEGETETLLCSALGKPMPRFSWIKVSTRADLSKEDRFSVDANTGALTIRGITKDDHGDYKCVAQNPAGKDEQIVKVTVILKPRIVALKNISILTDKEAVLSCSATGRPLPTVTFRKLTSEDILTIGSQKDDRITVDNVKDPAKEETVGKLIVSNVLRTDDGLYECIAANEGGKALKNGHLTVEFKPSFASTPMTEAWSWHNNPVNITCLAESIPNATISWRLRNIDISPDDTNIKKIGEGPMSTLRITPINQKYYGHYKCIARNTHGNAEHKIELKEAKPPSEIFQAKLEIITATTITFSFVGPAETGGLPTKRYAVQYKQSYDDWKVARNKTWPLDSPYILEGLDPQTAYDFRFAAQNDVGFGNWAAVQRYTMPKRSNPEEPKILTNTPDDEVVMSPYSDRFELTWRVPADNGEPIDQYTIKFCPVKKTESTWKEMENQCETKDLSPTGHTAYELQSLDADTHYKIELRAHNKIGFSTPGEVIIKTARDPSNTGIYYGANSSRAGAAKVLSLPLFLVAVSLVFSPPSCLRVTH